MKIENIFEIKGRGKVLTLTMGDVRPFVGASVIRTTDNALWVIAGVESFAKLGPPVAGDPIGLLLCGEFPIAVGDDLGLPLHVDGPIAIGDDLVILKRLGFDYPPGVQITRDLQEVRADVTQMVNSAWDSRERAVVAKYLRRGPIGQTLSYNIEAKCPFCSHHSIERGAFDDVYCWSTDWVHYVEQHDVKPPADFVAHVLKRVAQKQEQDAQTKAKKNTLADALLELWLDVHAYETGEIRDAATKMASRIRQMVLAEHAADPDAAIAVARAERERCLEAAEDAYSQVGDVKTSADLHLMEAIRESIRSLPAPTISTRATGVSIADLRAELARVTGQNADLSNRVVQLVEELAAANARAVVLDWGDVEQLIAFALRAALVTGSDRLGVVALSEALAMVAGKWKETGDLPGTWTTIAVRLTGALRSALESNTPRPHGS
ncbi:MAG: hypothetical protein ACHREM_06530 [Polyangiales bacterium]